MAALILLACLLSVGAAAQTESEAKDESNPSLSAEQILTQARALHAAGRFAAALQPLETYLASDPRNTVVRLEYARTLAILRRFPEAAREYRRLLETEPQNAAALVGTAKVASWQGQNQKALETYDRVLARNPTLYDALVGKAFVLLWMGRQEEARALFTEAQRQYPNDREVREALESLGGSGASTVSASPVRTDAAGEHAKPATDETWKPVASEDAKPAPAETPKPAPAEAQKPASGPPVASLSPGAVVRTPVAPPATRGSKTMKPTAAPVAVLRQESDGTQAAAGSSSPLRISLAGAIQFVLLGLVAVVVGAIAYRTYRVRLPAAPLPGRRVFELPPSSLVQPPQPARNGNGKEGPLAGRVLVVHPQEAVRDFARKVLAGAGAEVLALGRGEDAVVRLEKSPYDAIVVSDRLPAGWSGREIYRWLERHQPGAERKFVLALTDETDAEMQAFLEESRALAISAPFGVSDLLAMTRLAMGRARTNGDLRTTN
ncbi:MAG TPA: tetratricopeptide repeat protein [Terriglobales bacterium]|nr:tetratricopeptide repeat protein [Terriglobales bacterium]